MFPQYIHNLTLDILSCKYYSVELGGTRDHLFSYDAGSGLYDLPYLFFQVKFIVLEGGSLCYTSRLQSW